MVEHEGPQRVHRAADLVALDDVAGHLGVLDEVVHERVDAARAGVAEHGDRLGRQLLLAQHAGAQRVVDVVVDVGDAVDEPHDAPLERARQRRAAGVAGDPVAHVVAEVQARAVELEDVDDAQRVLVVAKAAAEALAQAVVEHVLADVAEGRVAEVVAQPDRLGEVLVEAQRARDGARDLRDLERVGQPRAEVVALGRDEDLGLVLEAPERLGVHDPVAVALQRRAQPAVVLGPRAPRRPRARRQRRQPRVLERAPARGVAQRPPGPGGRAGP